MAPSKYPAPLRQPLDIQECHKLGFLPISKQIPFRAWILTAILCSVACVSIVCATIWACSLSGLGLGAPHQPPHQQPGSNAAYTEDTVSRLMARRLPETNREQPTTKVTLIPDHHEPLNDVDELKNNAEPLELAKNTSKELEVIGDEGRKVAEESALGVRGKLVAGRLRDFDPGEGNRVEEEHQLPFKRIVSDSVSINEALEGNFKRLPDAPDNTQISSPDDVIGQTTTNLAHTSALRGFQPEIVGSLIPRESSFASRKSPPEHPAEHPADAPDWTLRGDMERDKKIDEPPQDPQPLQKHPDYADYGPEEYFYSELDAQAYYTDYDQGSWTGYIVEKIQDLHDWLSGDVESKDGVSKGNSSNTIPQVLQALNRSILQGDASILLLKLKDLYYGLGSRSQQGAAKSGGPLTNTSSPASFGLLTLDVMLLRNLQLMAWDDQETATNEVLNDPEVFAMNALFMEPEQVRLICQELKEEQTRVWIDSESLSSKSSDGSVTLPLTSHRDTLTSSFYSQSGAGQDLVDFAFSTIRAAVNLGRVFRLARTQIDKRSEQLEQQQQYAREIASIGADLRQAGLLRTGGGPPAGAEAAEQVTELDCVWTLYCRNLDKASRKSGIYGFLAKLNSLGLRLLVGELRADRAVDALMEETLNGARKLDCDRIFPRCSTKNAPKIVLEGIVGRISNDVQNKTRN